MQRMLKLNELNSHLCCMLCHGYLIDATTLVECSHSFCRSCLLMYLESSYNCPKCNTEIHKTKPLEYTRSDPVLQEIVYKLVPELYFNEENRKEKWKSSSTADMFTNENECLSQSSQKNQRSEESRILITLKYFRGTSRIEKIKTERVLQLFPTRYLCCQLNMPVKVLKKFVMYKFDISPEIFELDLWRDDETLLEHLTLKQLVQIYGLYRERKPLILHFSLYPKFRTEKESSVKTPSTNEGDVTGVQAKISEPVKMAADDAMNSSYTPKDTSNNGQTEAAKPISNNTEQNQLDSTAVLEEKPGMSRDIL